MLTVLGASEDDSSKLFSLTKQFVFVNLIHSSSKLDVLLGVDKI